MFITSVCLCLFFIKPRWPKNKSLNLNIMPFVFLSEQKTEGALKKRQEDGNFEGYTKDFFLMPEMKKYTKRCCRFVWKLVCQTMPYQVEGNWSFKANTRPFNSAYHHVPREAQTANEPTSGYISFAVWPGLFDGHSGRVIQKTEVVLCSI